MSKHFKKRLQKVGLAPGSLISSTEGGGVITISLIEYNGTQFKENNAATIKDCLISLQSSSVTWINIHGNYDIQSMEILGRHFGLHPLMLEDIVTSGQRPKLDDYKTSIFTVLNLLKYDQVEQEVMEEQVSIVLGSNYVISFEESPQDAFDAVRERLRKKNSRITQRGADYLCYALIDCVVDHAFVVLEDVDNKIEELEKKLLQPTRAALMPSIQRFKHDIILLRKSVWPLREVINNFRRLESPLLSDATKLYMQDVYDHTIQIIDTIESFRDLSSGLLDIYLTTINLRTNEIMKVLTVVATIFVPLTFIASIYGMNFDYMPELHTAWGYPAVLAFMTLVAVIMLLFFRRKKWI